MTDEEEPRAITVEEAREKFLDQLRVYVKYWANLPDKTDEEKCSGLAFSILNIFDGTASGLPALDITLRPHPSDKPFLIGEGENYYQDGMAINGDVHLHDYWHKKD